MVPEGLQDGVPRPLPHGARHLRGRVHDPAQGPELPRDLVLPGRRLDGEFLPGDRGAGAHVDASRRDLSCF